MFTKLMPVLVGLVISSPLWAFNCYLTVAKGSCWTKYKVNLEVIDSRTSKVLTTVTIPEGKDWAREAFVCEPSQQITYNAHFTPYAWAQDEDKAYKPYKLLTLPDKSKPEEKAWLISACFPADFSGVPYPLEAGQHCACDFSVIPGVPPQQ